MVVEIVYGSSINCGGRKRSSSRATTAKFRRLLPETCVGSSKKLPDVFWFCLPSCGKFNLFGRARSQAVLIAPPDYSEPSVTLGKEIDGAMSTHKPRTLFTLTEAPAVGACLAREQ